MQKKITFGGVHLDHQVDRLGGMTVATSSFRSSSAGLPEPRPGYEIELDVASGLVTIAAAGGGAIVVPRARVQRFEPLPRLHAADDEDVDDEDDETDDVDGPPAYAVLKSEPPPTPTAASTTPDGGDEGESFFAVSPNNPEAT